MSQRDDLPPVLADSTFEALLVDWDGSAVRGRAADVSRVRARIEALCTLGMHVFMLRDAATSDVDPALPARPSGPGQLHVCLTRDKSDSARWAASWLAARGITGALVLVAGGEFGANGVQCSARMLVDELARAIVVSVGVEPGGCPRGVWHVGGGPRRLCQILDMQSARRRARRVPSIDGDPSWVVTLPRDPAKQRVAGALATLANGWAGSRGGLEEAGPASLPLFAVNGVYTHGPNPALLAGPRWDALDIDPAVEPAHGPAPFRILDLRTGVLVRDETPGLQSMRFASAARPSALAMRAEGPATRLKGGPVLAEPAERPGGNGFERTRSRGRHLARTRARDGGGITIAARDRRDGTPQRPNIERLAAWLADGSRAPSWDAALDLLVPLEDAGFERLLAEHREEWARRWSDADVRIEGDPAAELAARFAIFHLLTAAPGRGEAAVGARGLTGHAYGGHVFWDADVFVLPALAAIRPGAARAMLEYRIRRLPAARAAAAAEGRLGARFPWESAGDGTDVTPSHVAGQRGQLVPVLSGQHQEHIVADVAWAAWHYAAWTGDTAFLAGPGRDLVVETARYWASRVRESEGRGHIDGVMGPDEYHVAIDDNAYTNVMARWNLRRAADLVEGTGSDQADTSEATVWRDLADTLVDGYDPERGLHEQFAGYWQLEPLLAAEMAPRPFAAELLLGAERLAGSQVIKQPDVVMLHHLVPDEAESGALAANLAYYEPRTAHGSSLSPAIYAAQLARARRPTDALSLFHMAARLDLDDVTGTTAWGLHFATFGGLWQALAHGFLGLQVDGKTLGIDPCLPPSWSAVALRLRFQGHPIGVRAEHDRVSVSCTEPLTLRVGAGSPQLCKPPGCTLPIERS